MEIIERYTSAAMKLDDLRREKARLKDEVIPAEVKQALCEIDEEFFLNPCHINSFCFCII